MEQIIETKRYYRQHFSEVEKSDGSIEQYNTIRSGIAFPQEKTTGLILVGGILRDEEVIKILAEKDFNTLSEAVGLVKMFYEKFLLYALYYQDLPENEAFGVFLQRNNPQRLSIRPAPYTEKLDFGIPLINDYLANDKLLVPKGGILSEQLQSDWGSDASERTLHGIVALFCLLAGMHFDLHLFDAVDLEAGLL